MFTILSEIDRKTSQYSLLIVREAISSLLQFQAISRYKNTQLQKKEFFKNH